MPSISSFMLQLKVSCTTYGFLFVYHLVLLCRSMPSDGKYLSTSMNNCQTKEKTNEASIISHSKPPSFSSTESSEGGKMR